MATLVTAIKLAPMVFEGIKEGISIYERLVAGDKTAEQQAADWLGITGKVDAAIREWEDSKK